VLSENGGSWIRAALLAGAAYFVVGKVFAFPVTHVQIWRLSAWVVSAVVFGTHIGYELFRLRHTTRVVATHTALAVGIGALLLAVAGAVHHVMTTPAFDAKWLLAFIVWPLATAVPAFLVSLVAAAVLARFARTAPGS